MGFDFLLASSGLNIFLTILEGLAVLALCVFLFFRIRRERAQNFERKLALGDSSIENFTKYLSRSIETAGKRRKFFVFRVDYRDYEAVFKALGQTQLDNLQKQQLERLGRISSWGAKAAVNKPGSYYLLVKNTEGYDIDRFAGLIIQNLAVRTSASGDFSIDIDIDVAAGEYPECGGSAEEIFKNLDIAMITAMRKGENKYAVYSLQLSNTETDEYKFYEEIRGAIKAKEFTLYYQPVVDTSTMEVCMGEALIRWTHKTRGVIPPSDFLYLMEQTGDIIWVGYWCFDQLVKQGAVWRSNYEQKFLLSFNLSIRQLMETGLADEFRRIATRNRVSPENYVLEITDMNVYSESDVAKENIDKLAGYGFKIAVDGFGGKFNTLSLFENAPIDMVKIEKSFWQAAGAAGIKKSVLNALLNFSGENNVTPIALWVDGTDIEYLNSLGITKMQGYAFSQPKNAKDFMGEVVLTPWSEELKRSAEAPGAVSLTVDTSLAASVSAAALEPDLPKTANTEDAQGDDAALTQVRDKKNGEPMAARPDAAAKRESLPNSKTSKPSAKPAAQKNNAAGRASSKAGGAKAVSSTAPRPKLKAAGSNGERETTENLPSDSDKTE